MEKNRKMRQVLAMVMSVCLIFAMVATAGAVEVNQAVNDAKNGVVQIQVWFTDADAAVDHHLHSGTGFLINEDTVVTCQHVATGFPDEWYVQWAQATNAALGGNRTAAQVKENLELRISIYRDVYVKATVKKASTEMDYAVLTLEEDIHNRTPLKLRDSSDLRQTESVYALGFPGDIGSLEDENFFDADDVTITSGHVNKVGNMSFITVEGGVYDSVNCVESSALITGGNSGGPLVDAEGYVVGINAAGNETRNIAISSKQLIDVLNALGITYTSAGKNGEGNNTNEDPSEEPVEDVTDVLAPVTDNLSDLIADAEKKTAKDYTEDSYKKLETAIEDAKAALYADSQDEVDSALAELKSAIDGLEAKKGVSTGLLIGIIAGAVVILLLIIIIIIVAVSAGKKKAKAQPSAAPAPAPRPAPTPRPVTPSKPAPTAWETTVLNQGAGETTVLSQGFDETTVLTQNVNGGFLIRYNNNERIAINSADFTVGRERNSVDYCVNGNTNISRVHARFVVRNGVTAIIDNKAANGTFVNGVKARAGQEIKLKDGDNILLADEKFIFRK